MANVRKVAIIGALVVGALGVSAVAMAAKPTDGGTRPGWGYGDQNHEHTGPPGQSVRPNGA